MFPSIQGIDFSWMLSKHDPFWYKQYAFRKRKKLKGWQKNHNKHTIKRRKR